LSYPREALKCGGVQNSIPVSLSFRPPLGWRLLDLPLVEAGAFWCYPPHNGLVRLANV
jgi:hypothetical protein